MQEERACCCRPSAVASNFAYRRRSPSSCAYACTVSSCAKASPAYETAAAPAAAARRLGLSVMAHRPLLTIPPPGAGVGFGVHRGEMHDLA